MLFHLWRPNSFIQESFRSVLTIECLLIDSVNGKNIFVPDKVISMYNDDIDMEKLSLHLRMLPDAIKSSSPGIV